MKKLGQKPDSYTITILLRGYKDRVKNKSPRILKALHIYDSMFKPNSSVKPQIIHSNAMLEACGRAGDLEMMFSVAARLKESGANSPDDITYTIIFNAIANAASGDQKNDHRLISHARSIWLDALKYWKTGRLVMNEQLVCSLGRVLLTGQYQSDRDDVFSLIQQTMRILRQFDRLGEEKSLHRVEDQVRMAESTVLQTENEKEAAARSLRGPEITSPEAEFDFNTLFDNAEQSQSQRSNDTNVSGSGEAISFQIIPEVGTEFIGHPDSSMNVVSKPEFDIIEAAGLVLAKPGNMTLSLLINACASIKQYDGAMKYWNLLKEKIPPDTLNYTDYMKLLKEARDSSAATNLLREIYKSSKDRKRDIQRIPMFFLYAMGACVEARQKTTALCDGTRILAILQMCAVEPQPQLVKMFTQIIARGQGHFPVKDVERAVESLMITFGNLKSLYAFGRTDGNGLNGTSAALTEVIHDVDSGWQPRIERNRFGLAKRRQEQLVEARSSVPMPERKDLRGLGRDIESVIGRVLDLYKKSMTQEQVSRIRADLLRVRAWIFPRHGEWKKLSHVENRQATDLSQLQENAQTYTQRPSYKEDYTANRHVGQNWNARNSYPHSDLGHMPTQRTSSSLADNIKIH